jgi:hypothetical protein
MLSDDQIAEVRKALRRMRRDAHPADKIANQLIKKYERLLREELTRRARQQQSHDDEAA